MNFNSLLLLAFALSVSPLLADEAERVLFKFDNPKDAYLWQTVNDGVMGGRSVGRFKINAEKSLEFFGSLSLESNGGFASVRARGTQLGLQEGDKIVAQVRGDGRRYSLNLYAQSNGGGGGYSYRQSFQTINGQWLQVEFPIQKFVATWRGRGFPNEKLDLGKANGLGIFLSDKQAGPFKLEVAWIKVKSVH
jgi:NADH dehydrogenase [ubiquinone] 1 alpha subcomplex assembly factor 1